MIDLASPTERQDSKARPETVDARFVTLHNVARIFAIAAVAVLAFVVLPAIGCSPTKPLASQSTEAQPATRELQGETMGTTYSVKYVGAAGDSADLQNNVDRLLEEINDQMSTYRPESEASRFNATSSGEWFPVSSSTVYVTQRALELHHATEGALDVTVGPLLRLWSFGPGGQPVGAAISPPTQADVDATRAITGSMLIEARHEPPALRKHAEGAEIDLSAIAKGYGVDAVAKLLKQRDIANFMVEIGGEVRAAGVRADGEPWQIGVESPKRNAPELALVVPLRDAALATSGDYRNFRSSEGELLAHVIDPRSGQPLKYRGVSVSVMAETCLEADALATALLVMGADEGYDWCVTHDVAALFQSSEEAERLQATPAFDAATKGP